MSRINPAVWPLPPVIAHRGASAVAPENTLPALLKAIELGAILNRRCFGYDWRSGDVS